MALLGLAAFCLVAGPSCHGDGVGLTNTGDLPSTGLAEIQPIFDAHCKRCHRPGGIGYLQTGGDEDNGLDLTSGASFASLVNQPTFEEPETSPRWRVLPGDPNGSYLVQKIESDSPKFGSRMPLDGPPFLSQGDIRLIRSWIEAGAPDR